MTRRDPIIEELHKLREAIGKAHDFDAHRIAETIRQHEDASRVVVIRALRTRAPRRKKAS